MGLIFLILFGTKGIFTIAFAQTISEELRIEEETPITISDEFIIDDKIGREENGQTYIPYSYIQKKDASHISKILTSVPGIEYIGSAAPTFKKIVIRGMKDKRVVQKVDGAKRNEQDNSTMPSGIELETENIKTISIQKGSDSVAGGDGALGGAVSYKSISARDYLEKNQEIGSRFKTSYDSNSEALKNTFSLFGRESKNFYYLAQTSISDSNRQKSGKKEGQYIEKQQTNKLHNTMIKIDYLNSKNSLEVKGEISKSRSLDSKYNQYTDDSGTNYVTTFKELTIKNEYRAPSPLLNLNGGAYNNKKDIQKETVTAYRGVPSTIGNYSDSTELRGAYLSNKAALSISKEVELYINTGFDYDQELLSEKDSAETSFYGKSSGNDLSIFANNEISFFEEYFVLSMGLRHHNYQRKSEKLAILAPERKGEYSTRSIGVSVQPIKGFKIFGKLNEAARAPALRELYQGGGAPFSCHWPKKICTNSPNSELNEENAISKEIGIEFKSNLLKQSAVEIRVSYFNETTQDYIQNSPVMFKIINGQRVPSGPNTATHRDYRSINQSKILRQGVEGEVLTNFDQLHLSASYSAMNIDCVDCVDLFSATSINEPLVEAPADKLSFTIGYEFTQSNLEISATGSFTSTQDRLSERYINAGYSTEGYQVYGIQTRWDPSFKSIGEVSFNLNIDNIFDKSYMVHNSGSGELEPGRSYRLGILKFF